MFSSFKWFNKKPGSWQCEPESGACLWMMLLLCNNGHVPFSGVSEIKSMRSALSRKETGLWGNKGGFWDGGLWGSLFEEGKMDFPYHICGLWIRNCWAGTDISFWFACAEKTLVVVCMSHMQQTGALVQSTLWWCWEMSIEQDGEWAFMFFILKFPPHHILEIYLTTTESTWTAPLSRLSDITSSFWEPGMSLVSCGSLAPISESYICPSHLFIK